MVLVQLTRRIQRRERAFVIFRFEGGFADVVIGLGRGRTLGKFFQQLPERVAHSLGILLLTENERLVLQSFFSLVRARVFRQNCIPIGKRRVIIFVLLICGRALRKRR